PCIENPLGRDARIAAPEHRRVRLLPRDQIGRLLADNIAQARLAAAEALVASDQARQCFVSGWSGSFFGVVHSYLCKAGSISTTAASLPTLRNCSDELVALMCMMRAITPVQPVWWLAPSPAPLSAWKYS